MTAPLTSPCRGIHTRSMTDTQTAASLFDQVAALDPLTAVKVRTRIERLQRRIEELESLGTTVIIRSKRAKYLSSYASSKGWRLVHGSDGPILARTFSNLDAAEMWLGGVDE